MVTIFIGENYYTLFYLGIFIQEVQLAYTIVILLRTNHNYIYCFKIKTPLSISFKGHFVANPFMLSFGDAEIIFTKAQVRIRARPRVA